MKQFSWSALIWPIIIFLSTIAAGLVTFVITDTTVRPFVIMWFLFVCPGMAFVGFLRVEEPIVEWVLALALSFTIDASVAAILLYAGRWSPTAILQIVMGICIVGALLQIGCSDQRSFFAYVRRRFS